MKKRFTEEQIAYVIKRHECNMIRVKHIQQFSYMRYNLVLLLKLLEVILKEFFKLVVFSANTQKNASFGRELEYFLLQRGKLRNQDTYGYMRMRPEK